MIIDGEWDKKIIKLWNEKRFDIAKKEVFKYRLRNYDKLERIEDKITLDYRMAFHEYKDKNVELANIYFKSLEDIFSDKYVKESCEYDYYRYRWLYVNNNEYTLSDAVKIYEMLQVYNYFKSIGRKDMTISALENIAKIKGNEEGILTNLRNLLQQKTIQEWSMVESILEDCEKISHNLYIQATHIVNEYRDNSIIDIV